LAREKSSETTTLGEKSPGSHGWGFGLRAAVRRRRCRKESNPRRVPG
jgi:hypothetical protein